MARFLGSLIQFLRLRVYSFEHARLFAFELLVVVKVFVREIDGELQVAAMHAAKAADVAGTDTEHALPNRGVVGFENRPRAVRIIDRAPDERFTSAC